MGDIFLKLLNMSITAGWLILAVLCIRLLFRKIPKWVNCLLWGVVAFRLICPISIESQFSILPSTEPIKSSTVVGGEVQNYIPSIDSRLTIVENTINPMLTEAFAYNESDSMAPLQAVTYAAGSVWYCGVLLLLVCAMGSAIKLHKLVREAVCVRGNIYICDAVKSPFILGIVRPRVYLPSALSEGEMDYILAHESAHLKRKDHWWKALGYLLLCLYWFNPLCWMAYSLLCKDIELACDEKVARDMTFHEKKEYSKVLLSCARQRSLIMVCPLAFGEVGIKERVKSVLNYKKPTLWIMIATAAVLVILAVCFLTNPTREYQIKITIPAGSTEPICYSDEEISPKGNTLTFYAGEGLGDTEITLLPIEVREENAYDETTYITPGMPVKMDVEKGAWFKIGVNIQNPTDESKDVYLSVRNVEVRIASSDEAKDSSLFTEKMPGEEDAARQETFADMQVSDILNGSSPITISREDASVLRVFLESGEWGDGTSDCLDNCELIFDGNTVKYHSDCGTFNDSVYNRHISLSEENRTEVNAVLEKYISLQADEMPVENDTIQNILLYEQPEADKICIKVQPPMIREYAYYYYIPTDQDQEWLLEQVQALDLEGEPWDRRWEGHKEKGWQIIYNDVEIRAFEGGYLYYTYDDEKGMMECFIEAPKLCDYIQIMLMEKIGYQNYDVSDIKDIVSAKLDVKSAFTGGQFYSQTITDAETLQKFEEWFRNAEYMYGGTECGTQCACLELTLANGDVVKLSMATDSCPNFHIDGVAYDYRPVSDWNNSEFYKCFNEIPWEYE
ncbi:MAG: M56 family metallopeptidase [Lachnospiraceae bacterium]|nr:M56 family metallopeptidase [Lachnospiraceae bacterium]